MLTHLATLVLTGATSMTIYLYVKQHSITKLKYFGKTTCKNPYKYRGSGKYWINHCDKHGWDKVETLRVWKFNNQTDCTDFALNFSKANMITSSDEWANLMEENALPGASQGRVTSEETKRKISKALTSRTKSEETKLKMSKSRLGKSKAPFSKQHKENLSTVKRGIPLTKSHRHALSKSHKNRELHECIVCGQYVTKQTMGRYHKHN